MTPAVVHDDQGNSWDVLVAEPGGDIDGSIFFTLPNGSTVQESELDEVGDLVILVPHRR